MLMKMNAEMRKMSSTELSSLRVKLEFKNVMQSLPTSLKEVHCRFRVLQNHFLIKFSTSFCEKFSLSYLCSCLLIVFYFVCRYFC